MFDLYFSLDVVGDIFGSSFGIMKYSARSLYKRNGNNPYAVHHSRVRVYSALSRFVASLSPHFPGWGFISPVMAVYGEVMWRWHDVMSQPQALAMIQLVTYYVYWSWSMWAVNGHWYEHKQYVIGNYMVNINPSFQHRQKNPVQSHPNVDKNLLHNLHIKIPFLY